jgi:exodeoxyribonuclease-3
MKVVSWNVNGLRSVLKKNTFYPFVDQVDPDIICIQECRATPEQLNFSQEFMDKYPVRVFNNPVEKKGYSGTAIFSKIKPIRSMKGIGNPWLDQEGRVITLEFESFFIINVYVPNTKNDLSRLGYRVNDWDPAFRNLLVNLEIEKPVIVCGDFNVVHKDIDIHNPKIKNAPGMTHEERESFNLLFETFVDSFRIKNPQMIKYSWWSNMGNSRTNNKGWRIDYILTSKLLSIDSADVMDSIMGSDHCPCYLSFSPIPLHQP